MTRITPDSSAEGLESAQSLTPVLPCGSTLGQLSNSYKKKKKKTEREREIQNQAGLHPSDTGAEATAQVLCDSHAGSACGRRLFGVTHMHGQMQPVWLPLCQFPAACHWGWGGHCFKVTMWLLFIDYRRIKGTSHRLHVSACSHRPSL